MKWESILKIDNPYRIIYRGYKLRGILVEKKIITLIENNRGEDMEIYEEPLMTRENWEKGARQWVDENIFDMYNRREDLEDFFNDSSLYE